jgi:protein-S-isoprenylcysteine O-methyltransferase
MAPGHWTFFAVLAAWIGVDTWVLLRDRGQAEPAERASKFVMVGCIVVGMTAGVVLSPGARQSWLAPFDATRWAGVVLLALTALTRLAIVRWFGREFTVEVRAPAALITTGPYRLLRHPAYAAELGAFAGVALALADPLGSALALILPTAGLLYRVHAEERVLAAAFGERWAAYAHRTKRLVPFLY